MRSLPDADLRFMREALTLARAGVALVSPNPAVGAVLVKEGVIVGRGMHTYEGRKHAEVLAIEDAGEASRGATLYLNLEPCSHHGRTPPCADAVIAAGIRRAVCSMEDPNPSVAGQGFVRLRAAGIAVEVGLLESEARELNEGFAKWIQRAVPFVTLKAGMSLDAKIAAAAGDEGPRWITSEAAREHAQILRHEHDAIVVGIGTVQADDPLLTDRTQLPRRRPLQRIVLDRELRMSAECRLVRSAQEDLRIVCDPEHAESEEAQRLRQRGVRVVGIARGEAYWQELLRHLAQESLTSLLIEGGASVFGSALRADVVDKLALYVAPTIMGAHALAAFGESPAVRALSQFRARSIGGNLFLTGYIHDPYKEPRVHGDY